MRQIERVRRARSQLVMGRHPFYGCLALGLKLEASTAIATMATDGKRLVVNEEWTSTLDDDELRGVIVHEVMHVPSIEALLAQVHVGKRDVEYGYVQRCVVREHLQQLLAWACDDHGTDAGVELQRCVDIDLGIIKQLLTETFADKPKLIDSNLEAIMLGHDYAMKQFTCPLPVRAEKMGDNAGKVMMEGNAAAALGAVYAGATVGAWYPITPSTSVMDAFKSYCDMFRTDRETGERRYCIIQAEDELAAAGIPTVMMFVQSLHGISHNKIEDTKEEHIELSVRALDRLADKTLQWMTRQRD